MATKLNPYLSFTNTARDAMEFYKSIFGGELNVFTFGDMGAEDETATLVMHASLVTPSGYTLFASDTPPGMTTTPGSNITISLSGPLADEAELRGYWDALAADGTVHMTLEKQVWGDIFGQLVDQYGIPWMVNIGQE
ncbi:VOC family protein [Nocardioides sp. Kera G14]|uniref:VOC family protein n=1 Tax=Nocardioides sp. Kera G14 TaxID=2884264 RepID=UPI001D11C265|nr:VOC family protein [Nocardioides sp. Kera G14]UDY23159.1 VOC family protein [Nocardioides sp. Kera G14]